MTEHQGACSRVGVRGGVPPRHGCCVQARDKTCDPAPGGMLEGGEAGTAAVSKHETKSVTQHQGACSRGGFWGGFPPGTAAVSKYETGTATKQTTGAREGGSGGGLPPARLLCPSTRQAL